MYQTLLGEGGFRKGMDLYFERHDGQAVSCDDFRAAMADANNVDLDQFERWYLQVRDTVTIHRLTPWRYDTRQDGIWDMGYVYFCLFLPGLGVIPHTSASSA